MKQVQTLLTLADSVRRYDRRIQRAEERLLARRKAYGLIETELDKGTVAMLRRHRDTLGQLWLDCREKLTRDDLYAGFFAELHAMEQEIRARTPVMETETALPCALEDLPF